MSDKLRYVRGDAEKVFSAPASATVIEVGDMLFQHPTDRDPKNAGAMLDQGTPLLNRDTFQEFFLGVSESRSESGDTKKIGIITAAEVVMDCAAATFDIGDMVGAAEESGGTALEDQKVIAVTGESEAIGVVTEKYGSNTTEVRFRVRSTIMRNSIQAQVVGSSSGPV
jgi:hypothetical protein